MTNREAGTVLWECDQCAYREWRRADQEPWPCVVCGYERWRAVREHTTRDDVPDPGTTRDGGRARDR